MILIIKQFNIFDAQIKVLVRNFCQLLIFFFFFFGLFRAAPTAYGGSPR